MLKEIRSFNYVNPPYERVRDALTNDAPSAFSSATQAAASRTQSVAAALHVNIAGLEVAKDVDISIKNIEEDSVGASATPRTRLAIEWAAASSPGLFPMMKAELAVYPRPRPRPNSTFMATTNRRSAGSVAPWMPSWGTRSPRPRFIGS